MVCLRTCHETLSGTMADAFDFEDVFSLYLMNRFLVPCFALIDSYYVNLYVCVLSGAKFHLFGYVYKCPPLHLQSVCAVLTANLSRNREPESSKISNSN